MSLKRFARVGIALLCAAGEVWAQAGLLGDLNPDAKPDYSLYGQPQGVVAGQDFGFLTLKTANEGREPWRSDGTAAGTFLLKDVNPGSRSSEPYPAAFVGRVALFWANNAGLGYGLWRSDGTVPGTTLVKDIDPGSSLAPYSSEMVVAGRLAFFPAFDGKHGCEVWRSDGTPEGTFLPKDTSSSTSSYQCPTQLFPFGGAVYYTNDRAELWRSDGSWQGTTRLARDVTFHDPMPLGSGLLFFDHHDLWKTNGTNAGTVLVKSFDNHGHDTPAEDLDRTAVVNGVGYFTADDGEHGMELWRTDGTPEGTKMVKDIFADTDDALPRDFTQLRGRLFFIVLDPSDAGPQLWRTDGTREGTEKVKDILGQTGDYVPGFLEGLGDTLFFLNGGEGLGLEPWVTDGTTEGTHILLDVNPGSAASLSSATDFRAVAGRMVFSAKTAERGAEPWASDGTPASTVELGDLREGALGSEPELFSAVAGRLLFAATDANNERRLWATDGTEAGTRPTAEPPQSAGSAPARFTRVGGALYFSASGGDRRRLWRTDGSSVPAPLSASGLPGGPFEPTELTGLGQALFFGGYRVDPNNLNNGYELWKTDGTDTGTRIVKDFSEFDPKLGHFKAFGGRLFFTSGAGSGRGLWKSDGTSAGTGLVAGVEPLGVGERAGDLYEVGGALVFAAATEQTGLKLWRSTGTAAGTAILDTPSPGGYGVLYGKNMALVGGRLFFVGSAIDGSGAYQLWKTDGTPEGTLLVKQIGNSSAAPHMERFTASGGRLFFVADDGAKGVELWKSDGTAAGTVLVKDIAPGSASSNPDALTDVGGVLYFSAYDAEHGVELWRSDGTAAGTFLVKDVWPGALGSGPSGLYSAGGQLFFTATNGNSGLELWLSDGSAAGTDLVQDIAAGAASAEPRDFFGFVPAGRSAVELVFSADDGRVGREPWLGGLDGLPTPTPTPTVTATPTATATATPTGTPTPLAEGDLSVRGPWRTDTEGGEVRVPVVFHSGGTALGAYSASLDYDAALLELVRVEGGGAAEFAAAPVSRDAGGTVRLCGLNDQSLSAPVGETEVAALIFRARAGSGSSALRFHGASFIGAEQGEALALNPIEGRLDVAAAVGSFGLPALLSALLGVVALAWRRPGKLRLGGAALALSLLCAAALAGPRLAAGDVDGDGFVTRADATRVQEALVGLRELTGEEALRADVDGSGGVELLDALRIAQAAAGLIAPLPTPTPTPSPTPP